jgi:hypothetical protein
VAQRKPKRQTSSDAAKRSPPPDDEAFMQLLWTWPVRYLRRPPLAPRAHPREGEMALEACYGRGDYDERREDLLSTIDLLRRRGVDPDAVFAALDRAKHAEAEAARELRRTTVARGILTRRDRWVKRMRETVHEGIEVYRGLAGGAPSLIMRSEMFALLVRQSELLDPAHADAEVVLTPRADAARRLPRRGRPRAPWIEDARRGLRAARVPRAHIEILLSAVGLT